MRGCSIVSSGDVLASVGGDGLNAHFGCWICEGGFSCGVVDEWEW